MAREGVGGLIPFAARYRHTLCLSVTCKLLKLQAPPNAERPTETLERDSSIGINQSAKLHAWGPRVVVTSLTSE